MYHNVQCCDSSGFWLKGVFLFLLDATITEMSHTRFFIEPRGYSLLFYTGVRVNTWGLRFYKKIIFGVFELQLNWGLRISA